MSHTDWLSFAYTLDVIALVGTVGVLTFRRAYKTYPTLFGYATVCMLHASVTLAILFHRQALGISKQSAYRFYFDTSWAARALETMLVLLTVYSIYKMLMEPLDGLHRAGRVVFHWVAGVSLVLAALLVFGPHFSGINSFQTLCGQAQEGVSMLTLCLLAFVSLTTRPLGLTVRSRLFGVTLGLGLMAAVDLVQSMWMGTAGARNLYSPIYLCNALGTLAGWAIVAVYFTTREPARKLFLLPTTSPFFFWNRVSEALEDSPGVVAFRGIDPEMFAPAELTALRAPLKAPAPVVEMPHAAQR